MADNKLNLTTEVKLRLRRSVLNSLSSSTKRIAPQQISIKSDKKNMSATKPKTIKPIKRLIETPPSDSLVVTKPRRPARSQASGKGALRAKIPVQPNIAAGVEHPVAPIPSPYRPFAKTKSKRDWERPQKEESLEKLFSRTEKQKFSGKFDSFSKAPHQVFSRPRQLLWKLVGLAVLLIVLVIFFVILGIYRYGFNNTISAQLASILHLPAGYVDNQMIGAGDYLTDLRLLATPLSLQREGLIDYSGQSDPSDRIFYRLAANKLVKVKLEQYGKPVTKEDLDAQAALLLKQTGGQAAADKIIQNLYGFNFNQFKSLVLLPMMQRANLQTAIISDDSLPITAAAKVRADEVLKSALASSTDFSALAKQYTDDESSVNTGGDLGWVTKGQLNTAWENLIFNAATGTVITQLIVSDYGFHIVKVEQKAIDKTTGAVSVKLRHILIKVDVDKYIKELLNSAKIVKYINN